MAINANAGPRHSRYILASDWTTTIFERLWLSGVGHQLNYTICPSYHRFPTFLSSRLFASFALRGSTHCQAARRGNALIAGGNAAMVSAMKIHEYQARQILVRNGIPVPAAEVVRTPERRRRRSSNWPQPMCVVKAQVYAGGRGKAGFVKLVKSADEARDAAKFMLSHRMVSESDRAGRRAGFGAAGGAGRGYRQGILPRHDRRSRPGNGHDDRLGRGRRGDRGSREEIAGEGPQGAAASADGIAGLSGPRSGVSGWVSRTSWPARPPN